jgi:plastocyanin
VGEGIPSADIQITNNSFQSPVIKVAPGTEVIWVNNDLTPHTVTADDGSFDSGVINANVVFSHRFQNKGIFRYHCEIHLHSHGEIVVE